MYVPCFGFGYWNAASRHQFRLIISLFLLASTLLLSLPWIQICLVCNLWQHRICIILTRWQQPFSQSAPHDASTIVNFHRTFYLKVGGNVRCTHRVIQLMSPDFCFKLRRQNMKFFLPLAFVIDNIFMAFGSILNVKGFWTWKCKQCKLFMKW